MEHTFEEPCQAYYTIFTDQADTAYKYRFLSPFEFKSTLISHAEKSVGKSNVLNAGRGNPNFFSTIPRYAFSLLIEVCTAIGDKYCKDKEIGFAPPVKGISKKFDKEMKKLRKTDASRFLEDAISKMRRIVTSASSGVSKDAFIHDLVISTLGSFYPSPPRVQQFVEPVLAEFLDKRIYRSKKKLVNTTYIFPTEGAANAILYVFNSLKYNGLVIDKDKIAIMSPIFSPYLEIPSLRNYDLEQICVAADENDDWEVPDSEIAKLADPKIRALFLVNPTNPTSLSLSGKTVRKIAAVVRKNNPNLIILADNVYAPFVDEFNSFFNVLPRNTIGVYSFSKYFGVTGWRLGTIIMHKNNLIDSKLLKEAPQDVHNRYKMLTTKPESIKFIDRIVADSRQVAETHVAGLSTPQQTQMCLLAMFDLLRGDNYRASVKDILYNRLLALLDPLQIEYVENKLSADYYYVINIAKTASSLYNDVEFGEYLKNHRDSLEFLLKLAKNHGTVLLPAMGFAGPFWGVRVSLANLNTNDYSSIGENVRDMIGKYYDDYEKWKRKEKAKEKEKGKEKGTSGQ